MTKHSCFTLYRHVSVQYIDFTIALQYVTLIMDECWCNFLNWRLSFSRNSLQRGCCLKITWWD